MTDVTPAGGAPAENDGATTPSQQTAPSPEYVTKADFDAGLERLAEGLAKRLRQSQKDVIEDRLEKSLDKLFGKPGATPPSAPEPPAPQAPPQATPAPQVSGFSGFEDEIKAILDEQGLSGQEPELREYAEANKGKRWFQVGPGFAQLAADLKARKAGSPAGVIAPTGSKAPSPNLAQEYVDEVAAARAAGRYGPAVLRDIKAKYREKGLAVENVRLEIPGVPVPARGKSDGLS